MTTAALKTSLLNVNACKEFRFHCADYLEKVGPFQNQDDVPLTIYVSRSGLV